MSKETMTSSRPYMIRALHEWIVDNSLTPYLMVFARAEGVEVPQQYVNSDGQIVLNIAPRAVVDLQLTNEAIFFKARFGGVPMEIYVPCHAVLGIYARENGKGMMFDAEVPPQPPSRKSVTEKDKKPQPEKKGPNLRVVK